MALLLLLLLFVVFPGIARTQSHGNAPLILELPASTRGLGMGGAFDLSSPDADAIFAAPSVLATARGVSLGVQRYGSASTLLSLSSAVAWGDGVMAMGLQSLSYGALGMTLVSIPNDAEVLLSSGSYGTSELVVSLGYGRSIKGIQVGLVSKFIEQRIAGDRDATAGIDVGIAKSALGISWALSAHNLGSGLKIGDELPLPHRLTFGASSRRRPVGPLDLSATTAVSRRRDGEVIPAAGLEVSYWPIRGRTFTGRVGVRRVPTGGASPVTFGAAFTSDNLAFDYAYEGFDVSGAAHRFGIRWVGIIGGTSP